MSEHDSELKPSKPAVWNDPKYRALFFQIVLVLALGYFIVSIVDNTLTNMESRGISTGFAFLSEPSGFGILQSLIEFDESHTYGRTFFVGLLNTLLVAGLGIFFATLLGFVMGVARLSNNWIVSKVATVYIEIFRNIPLLLQIFFWYFAVLAALPGVRQSMSLGAGVEFNNRGLYLPSPVPEDGFSIIGWLFVIGIIATVFLARWAHKRQEDTGQQFPVFFSALGLIFGLPLVVFLLMGSPLSWDYPTLKGFNFQGGISIIPELLALLLALTIYTGTFIAETVRAGINAVSHGQTEAAMALGFTRGKTMRLIIIPQAMRVIIPPLTSQYLNLAKNSSLATAIGYPDIVAVFMGTTLNQTGQAVEITMMTMGVYLTISLTISMFMNWFNKRMALVER
ncbi:MAG: amino acid ABC transporter permease [Gammaproteobacteria bacterium]|mgnify:FL=1|jgi:general L-amino acid transport system permease protein|nr:amino acid ABC transporter permease [Gammaproteobacteria bacterium]MBT3722535.1 amino acid ABC transporter permease [Gammaproteobacteria bacterium]MBT4077281.1 amino acid ABC transporter permease [Gammaproteobacteria bacterium]MBT4450636.1 amino acid ABC transporter permease [Gammaproteobacteria bacterium]MBT4863323.1 amino acid ABC transporter permease [Gammaproteobacteria bacterium]